MLNYLTTETQVCVVLVLVLLIVLMSGIVGYGIGWMRCVEYIENLNMKGVDTDV